MSNNYKLAEKLLLSLRCSRCVGEGSTQYAASSPVLACDWCKGSGLSPLNRNKHAYIAKCIQGVITSPK